MLYHSNRMHDAVVSKLIATSRGSPCDSMASCNGLVFGWTLLLFLPNLKFVALPVPEIIAIRVFGGGCEPQPWGRGGRRVSGMVPLERALVTSYTSYRPSIVTFPLALCVSEILPLLCTNTPLFLTLPLAAPKFTMDGLFGYEEQIYWTNYPCN